MTGSSLKTLFMEKGHDFWCLLSFAFGGKPSLRPQFQNVLNYTSRLQFLNAHRLSSAARENKKCHKRKVTLKRMQTKIVQKLICGLNSHDRSEPKLWCQFGSTNDTMRWWLSFTRVSNCGVLIQALADVFLGWGLQELLIGPTWAYGFEALSSLCSQKWYTPTPEQTGPHPSTARPACALVHTACALQGAQGLCTEQQSTRTEPFSRGT